MNDTSKVQSIELNKKQFLTLLKIVYLGNWMANAHRVAGIKKEYEAMEDFIFSLAPRFGLKKYMTHDSEDGDSYYPSNAMELGTDVRELVDEYDDETLWEDLMHSLGERDFLERFSERELRNMSWEERFEKEDNCVDFYAEEFEKHGLDRLRVKE